MIIVPANSTTTPGRNVIAFMSDGGTEAAADYTWEVHTASMLRLNSFVRTTKGAGVVVTAGDNGVQGAGVNGGYAGQCGALIGPKESIRAVMGNHDSSDMGGDAGFLAYFGYPSTYYSWSYGNIEGYGINAYTDGGTELSQSATQWTWLSSSLAWSRANRTHIKWRLAHFHVPVQCSPTNHPPNPSAQAIPWTKWGINLCLHGHNHCVERLESGSLAVYLNGGISNQKLGYQYTGTSAFSKYIYTNYVGAYPYVKDYIALLIESEGNYLSLSLWSTSGSRINDTGSTSIPNATFTNNTLILFSETGSPATSSGTTTSQPFSIVSNRFVESGSWTLDEIAGGGGGGQTSSNLMILPRNSKWNVYQSATQAPSVQASNSGSTWASASYEATSSWTGSLQAPMRNVGNTKTVTPGWDNNFHGLQPPSSGSITHYFRTTMSIADTASYNFTMSCVFDDAIAVWINEKRAYTNYMDVTWSWNSFGSTANTDYTRSWEQPLDRTFFLSGTNIIAAEVHQENIGSSDVGFGLEIVASGSTSTGSAPGPTGSNQATASIYLSRKQRWNVWASHLRPSTFTSDSGSVWPSASYDDTVAGWTASLQGPLRNSANAQVPPAGWEYNYAALAATNANILTHYFRTTWSVAEDPNKWTYGASYIFDDGVQVWINEKKAISNGMPANFSFGTSASITANATAAIATTIDPSFFVSGTNYISAEVHQVNNASSDVAWGLEITGSINTSYSSGSATGSSETGSVINRLLIHRTGSLTFYDGWGDPATGSFMWISASWYANGSASTWKNGSGSFHNVAEVAVLAAWPYNTDLNFTSATGPYTHLFAKTFDIPSTVNSSDIFRFNYIKDDGIYAYVNGNRVVTTNILNPGGFNWYASASATAEADAVFTNIIPASYFQSGSNLLVVELHQTNSTTTDVAFGMELEWSSSSSVGSTPTTEIAVTGSKLTFGPFGVTTLIYGKMKEVNMSATASDANKTRVARLSPYGHFMADTFSEIPVTTNLVFRSDAADSYSTQSLTYWKDTLNRGFDWKLINTPHVPESGSYKFTNKTSNTDIANASYMTLSNYTNAFLVKTTGSSWTGEVVFKLSDTCSLIRGCLLGRQSGSAVFPNRRATGFFTEPDNTLKVSYFHSTPDNGTTWQEQTASLGGLVTDQWYHALVTYEVSSSGTSSFKTYLNGLLQTTNSVITSSYDIREGTDIYIGGAAAISNSVALVQSSNAYVAIAALYNRALSAIEARSCTLYYNKEHPLDL